MDLYEQWAREEQEWLSLRLLLDLNYIEGWRVLSKAELYRRITTKR